jgi:hypothetical protein
MYLPIDSARRERIFRNFNGGHLSCEVLVEILERRISPGAMPARNKLVKLLAECRAHRNLDAHSGKNTTSLDGTMHYTVYVDNQGYHLRLDNGGNVFQITKKTEDLGVIPPWVPPGAYYDPEE